MEEKNNSQFPEKGSEYLESHAGAERREKSQSDSSSIAESSHIVSAEKESHPTVSRDSIDDAPRHSSQLPGHDQAEAETAVPGHDLDLELAQVSHSIVMI